MTGQGTIIATGSIAYPVGLGAIGATIGAEKVMTMTSTYDHRIIQGAESGRFLALIEEHLQGEHGFYEDVFTSLGVELGAGPARPAPALRRGRARRPRRARRPGRARSFCRRSRRRACSSAASAATATSRRAWTRSAPSPRATPASTPRRSA